MFTEFLTIPLINTFESVVGRFREQVHPRTGSVLYCSFVFGYMEYSGIYIGNREIVRLSGSGEIEVVSPEKFIKRTTALKIYVSCYNTSAVGSGTVANRAKEMVGKSRDYNLVFDSCHQFTAGCLNGEFENSCKFLRMLKKEAKNQLGANSWRFWDTRFLLEEIYST